jgi:ATP-dependent Clp protease ATP-binding subunit ClpC
VPSQLALPPDLLAYRHRAGGLLYRSRPADAEPRVRPLVLLLDVSPASFGPVEALTRPTAVRAARAALRAGVPVAAVLAGDRPGVCELRREADLAALLSARSSARSDAAGGLRLARAVCRSAADGAAEPAVLVLGPAWYGWDAPLPGPGPGRLRGLFVRPPGARPAPPPWAAGCDRWVCLAAGAGAAELDRAFEHLLG